MLTIWRFWLAALTALTFILHISLQVCRKLVSMSTTYPLLVEAQMFLATKWLRPTRIAVGRTNGSRIRLVARGQLVLQVVVRKAIWDADLQPKLFSNTLALGKPIEEVVATIAKKLRVLLAHYRLNYDNHTPGLPAPSGLENVFDRMQAPSHNQPSSKQARRMEHLSSMPHPFVHFFRKKSLQTRTTRRWTSAVRRHHGIS